MPLQEWAGYNGVPQVLIFGHLNIMNIQPYTFTPDLTSHPRKFTRQPGGRLNVSFLYFKKALSPIRGDARAGAAVVTCLPSGGSLQRALVPADLEVCQLAIYTRTLGCQMARITSAPSWWSRVTMGTQKRVRCSGSRFATSSTWPKRKPVAAADVSQPARPALHGGLSYPPL